MFKKLLILLSTIALVGCQSTLSESKPSFRSNASWYSSGKRTASGQRFNPYGYSAAHRTLPFGTVLHLTNPSNGRKISAIVNDRGPFVKGRTLDVSRGAASALGFINKGTTPLIVEVQNTRGGTR